MQHMKMPSFTTGKFHNVSLGGIFERRLDQNERLTNLLTIGGSWQLTGKI